MLGTTLVLVPLGDTLYSVHNQVLKYSQCRKARFSRKLKKAVEACEEAEQFPADSITAPSALTAKLRKKGVLTADTSTTNMIPLHTTVRVLRLLDLDAAAAALENPRYLAPPKDTTLPSAPHISAALNTPAVAAAVAAQQQATAAAQAASKVVANLAPSGNDPGPNDPAIIPRWPENLGKAQLDPEEMAMRFSILQW